MKVFFISTSKGEGQLRDNYHLIYDAIEDLGYTHITDFVEMTDEEFHNKMQQGRQQHIEFYNTMIDGIQSADICLFEATTPSLAVGFLIQRALEYSKPTIVLYYKENMIYFLSGIEDEKLIKQSYDEKNFKKVLRDSFAKAREKRDKRFNFFLSPKLLNYIEEASKARSITKSKLLRDMIVNDMRENKLDYTDE